MADSNHEKLPAYSECEVLASLCRESFADFVKEMWSQIVPDRLVWNWHMAYLCDQLQEMAERVIAGKKKKHDLIINISPGTSKSLLTSVFLPVWCWTRMPAMKVITASYAYSLATDLSRKSRDLIKSDLFRACYPDIVIRDDQDAKGHYLNTAGGERYAIGTGGSVIGKHAHMIIVDDPLDPNAATSDAELEKANRWLEETIPTRKTDKDVTPIILIMQRLHEFDPTGSRLAKANKIPVFWICLPAELTDSVHPKECREFYVDGLMDPIRLGESALAEAEAQGEYPYAAQFLQCLVGDTKVTTTRGLVAIRDVRAGDFVDTRDGMKEVLWSGETKKVDSITTTLFTNGSIVVGTPEHHVWTDNRGFIPLAILRGSDYSRGIIPIGESQVWADHEKPTRRQYGSAAGSTPKAGRAPTSEGRAEPRASSSTSTGMYGNTITAVSPMATTSITRTKTSSTIELRILNASLQQSITSGTLNSTDQRKLYAYLIESVHRSTLWPQHGKSTGGKSSLRFTVALCAEENSSPSTTGRPSTVLESAKKSDGSGSTLPKFVRGARRSLLRATREQSAAQTSAPSADGVPVYDLTVKDLPEFYADGILVHNSPIPRGGAMFHPDKIEVGVPTHIVRKVRYWDKAGTGGGGAFTVGALMGLDKDGRFWILDIVRGQWDSGRRERIIREVAGKDGKGIVIYIEQEPGSGGKQSAEGSIRGLAGYRVRSDKVGKSDGDKEARADAFSSQVNIGNVSMALAFWNDDLIKELRFFPRSRYKDQVDACSGAFNCLAVPKVTLGGKRAIEAQMLS